MQIRRDPVTVIGDETRKCHWPRGREDAGSRTIREPGDLPGMLKPSIRSSREEPEMSERDYTFSADTYPAHIEVCGICGRRVHRLPPDQTRLYFIIWGWQYQG